MQPAHRVAWTLTHGPIPDAADIDHVCRVIACCNPDPKHLEPVTHRENLRRGQGASAINAKKTHCPQGHEYTPENTIIRERDGYTGRECRICARESSKRSRAAWRRRQDMPERPMSAARRNAQEVQP